MLSRSRVSALVVLPILVFVSIVLSTHARATQTDTTILSSYVDGGKDLADRANAMVSSPDGQRVFATGIARTARGSSGTDYLTVAWDASNGSPLWTRRFGHERSRDRAMSISIGPNGRLVFVAGVTTGGHGRHAWTTLAYSASTGTLRWVAKARLPGARPATSFGFQPTAVLAGDGRVVVAGNTQVDGSTGDSYPAVVLAYSAATGGELWRSRYSPQLYPTATRGAIVRSAAVDPSRDRLYLGIQVDETPTANSEGVLAIDLMSGRRLWRSHYTGDAISTHPDAIAVAPQGRRIYLAGELDLEPRRLLAFKPRGGALAWDANLRSSLGSMTAIAPDRQDHAVFATGSLSNSSILGTVLKTWGVEAKTGEVLWKTGFARRSRSGSLSQGIAAVPNADGSVIYVAGDSSVLHCTTDCAWSPDIVTLAYDTGSGEILWHRILGDPAYGVSESAVGIALDPTDRRVLVVGTAPSADGDPDLVLIGYPATA
jgi:outer membrane protein assembly factor BamB